MKSVKYSAASKIKKLKQQQKVQSSFIQTLKEDDEICTGLLDTLSDDYLGYLENLMGKKSGKEIKINQHKIQTININKKNNPPTESNVNLNANNPSNTQQKSDIQQPNQEIVSSIVFIQPKRNNQYQTHKASQETKQIHLQVKKQQKPSPINQFKSQIKQKSDLMDVSSIKPKVQSERRNKSEDKFLIKNIQGYLQSLSKIKQKTSFQTTNQPQSSQNFKKSNKSVQKSHSVTLKNIHSKHKTSKNSSQTITHYGQKQQFSGRNQKKNIDQTKFSKNKVELKYKKNFRNGSLIGEIIDESQSQEGQQIGNDESFISLESEDNPTIPVRNRIFFGQPSKKSKKRINESGVIKANKRREIQEDDDIFKIDTHSPQDTSLELLLIKVITKYNKLLSNHSKCKSKMEELQLQFLKLQQQIQLKDAEIQRLTLINKQLIKDQQLSFSKASDVIRKDPQIIDDRRFVQQYGKAFFNKQEESLQQHLNKLNFRKKQKGKDGKAINIEKMFIIDNLELFQKPNHYYQSQLTLPNKSKVFTAANNDSRLIDSNIDKRQKRSISCRQKYKNYTPSPQELFNSNKTSYEKNIQKSIIKGPQFNNTFSYQKSNNLDYKINLNNQRQRAYSESLHSQPLRYKQAQNIKSNKSSNSQFSMKFKEKSHHLNINPPQFSVSSKYLKKDYPLLNNEESQSTDSQLLEKLLTIQNSYQCVKTGKAKGNKTFFK